MADWLIDSDVLIDGLNGYGDVNARLERSAASRPLFVSTISVFELERGARSSDELLDIRSFLGFFTILPLDWDCASEAASIDADLRRGGIRLDPRDTLIAGTARARGMEIVTRNRRHFERVPGLVVAEL